MSGEATLYGLHADAHATVVLASTHWRSVGCPVGVPPPSLPHTTLVTVDWRFLRKWSLETTVGDMGTSIVDLVWQRRY